MILATGTVFRPNTEDSECLSKKEISFVGRRLQLKPLPFCQERVRLFFRFVSLFGWPFFTLQNQDQPRSSPLQKGEHFPISALYQLIVVLQISFLLRSKNVGKSFRTWLLRAKW